MGKFTEIPADTFNGLQLDAGILTKNFDPAKPAEVKPEDIITATTGGINAVCQPTFTDFGEDIDNCPNNMMETKHLDSWNCSLAFTALGTSKEAIRLELGCADIDADTGAITPRADLKQSDFEDSIWWVGDRADGGCVAAELLHALSTEGFSLQTTKNGKGQTACTLTGHVSVKNQKEVPMRFYSIDPTTETTTPTTSETSTPTNQAKRNSSSSSNS